MWQAAGLHLALHNYLFLQCIRMSNPSFCHCNCAPIEQKKQSMCKDTEWPIFFSTGIEHSCDISSFFKDQVEFKYEYCAKGRRSFRCRSI